MATEWAVEEMSGADLKDKRLNDRLTEVLSALGERPTASIPAACGGYAEMAAAYRFFDNEKSTAERILAPHHQRTRERMKAQPVVLMVQDTTEADVTRPEQQMAGAGPLAAASRQGVFLHSLQAYTPNGLPLGEVWSDRWARDEASLEKPQEEKRQERKAAPIEEKESFRWLEGLRQARETAEECRETQCICVADSEADIYELFAEPRGPVHWLIRACQDRALVRGGKDEANLIHKAIEAPVLFTRQISVRGRKAKVACETRGRRQPRKNRKATVEVRAAAMTLRPPSRPDRRLPAVQVNVVLVREVDPPPDDESVEWILVTTLPIETIEQVEEIVAYYCVRWMIEIYFRTLKSGCRIEDRRIEHVDRFTACLAVYQIIAWRTLYVCHLGRSCPDLDCEAVFDPAEWKSVWVAVHRKSPPRQPPRLADMIRLIAQLGGYVNRTNRKDPPGPQTVWLGMQRMCDLAWAWETFGPGTKTLV
ncbi:MAG: IS4 family transposase [Planctomycetes bacterium]|nr:IS4 family transposase [Planctomycetota bacterium]